jgi:hypothetical protein
MNFEPKGGGGGAKIGAREATATCTTTMAPPFAATSFCLCYLWVLPTRIGDKDAITFDLSVSAFDLSTAMAFAFRLEFQ